MRNAAGGTCQLEQSVARGTCRSFDKLRGRHPVISVVAGQGATAFSWYSAREAETRASQVLNAALPLLAGGDAMAVPATAA